MRSSQVSVGDNALATQYNNLRDDAKGGSFLLPHQQGTPNMTLYVEAGIVYVHGTRVIFVGGNSPSFTAPTTNPRIDLLTIDNAGTLAITQGTEAASPSAPTYPTDKIVICEVYNRVGETSIKDTSDGTNGYIYNDVRPLIGTALDLAKIDRDVLPKTDNTYDLGSASFRWAEVRAASFYGDGANITGIEVTKITKVETAGETINGATTPVAIFKDDADSEYYACDANDTSRLRFDGFAITNGTNGNPITIQFVGIVTGFSGLTAGLTYYVSDSQTLITTPGTNVIPVGKALSATELLIIKQRYAAGGGTTLSGTGSSTVDEEIKTGFTPTLIRINYYVQGHDQATETSKYKKSAGIAAFNGTSKGYNWQLASSTGDSTSDLDMINNDVNSHGTMQNPNSGAGGASAGNQGANGGIVASWSLLSINKDGFTIRKQLTAGSGNSTTGIIRFSYEVFG